MGKYISCRKMDKKYFCIFTSLGIYFSVVSLISLSFDNLKDRFKKNVLMVQLINYIVLCPCIIPEIIIKKMGILKKNKNLQINHKLSFKNIMIIIFALILLIYLYF